MAQTVDFLVSRRILFNIGIRLWHIGFRLIIIVIGYEIINSIIWEEILELAGRLCRKCLIRRNNQCWPLHFFNDLGHGKSLACACCTKQYLSPLPFIQSIDQ